MDYLKSIDPRNRQRSCQHIRDDLKRCLLDSDCVKLHEKLPRECLTNPEMHEFVPLACHQLLHAFIMCKRSIVDMRSRFRGRPGEVYED
ncbi:hypothetical protein GJ496_002145 [Pomphorhynchus laevis]|nr:hypothetical protein GJ496_002145 [Pomphorhynchus laevis]